MVRRIAALALCICSSAWAQVEEEPLADKPIMPASDSRRPRYTLDQLVTQCLRSNPGITAAQQNLSAAQEQLKEANRAWWPSFSFEGLAAPSVDIHCGAGQSGLPKEYCLEADVRNPIQSHPTGILSRVEIRMGFPLYTFGKISAAGRAAEQGVHIAEGGGEVVRAELALNIRKAYYGAQVSYELLDMVKEGLERLGKALDQVERDLERGKGKATETDRLRLRVAESLVRARSLEARKGERLAMAALRTLTPGLPADFELQSRLIQPLPMPAQAAETYIDAALLDRPESKIVDSATRLTQELEGLAKSNLFPDLVLVGSYFRLWKTTENDDPSSPYMLHPFAAYGYGGALALRWELDFHLKIPRFRRAQYTHASAASSRLAARDGMRLEVTTAYESMREAHDRIDILHKAEQAAHSWLTAVAQNFAIGTAEAREFNDALFAYFDAHGRYLQSLYDYNVSVAVLTRLTGKQIP